MDNPNPEKTIEKLFIENFHSLVFTSFGIVKDYDVAKEFWEAFAHFLKPSSFGKNQLIKSSHKNETQLYLITKGSTGHFVLRERILFTFNWILEQS